MYDIVPKVSQNFNSIDLDKKILCDAIGAAPVLDCRQKADKTNPTTFAKVCFQMPNK